MLKIIRKLLLQIINDIDVGNTNINEEEGIEIINLLNKLRSEKYSKYKAYTYLNISRATFDNLVREGKLPRGIKEPGFKEPGFGVNPI